MRDGGIIQGEAAFGGARVVNFVRLADDGDGQPLHERLYRRIRTLIVSGALAHGSKLAPSRVLAEQLGISRNSVLNAIDRLVADGWLEARRGSGVYVAYAGAARSGRTQPEPPMRKTEAIPFKSGVPPLDLFPIDIWNRLQTRLWRNMPQAGLLEGQTAGQPALRQAIAAHLAAARGFDCSPDQIVVTSSMATGLDLTVRALGLAGTTAWVEDPGYGGTKQALHNGGMQLMPVPVDEEGFDIDTALRMGGAARAALVMPVAQFPMGAMLSRRRREALLAWALANNAWVLEDDSGWNDALATPERPLAAGAAANVIYLSSFNYTLFPALRIAYMVLPPELVDRFIAVRRGLDAYTNVPNQMILADFLDGGYFDDHLHRCRAALAERRGELLEILARRLGHVLVPRQTKGSSHLVCDLLGLDEEGFGVKATAQGIAVKQMRRLRLIAGGPSQVMLGYAFPPAAIRQAAETLADAFA
ncbi:MAG TPA: PLP-dependent aminotransferase family protein [Rhizomicrobium sp.]|jgi:GntR family transcriptional regulator/MocR family aminotransferase